LDGNTLNLEALPLRITHGHQFTSDQHILPITCKSLKLFYTGIGHLL
jgi:hypothetical protein